MTTSTHNDHRIHKIRKHGIVGNFTAPWALYSHRKGMDKKMPGSGKLSQAIQGIGNQTKLKYTDQTKMLDLHFLFSSFKTQWKPNLKW